MSNDNDVIARFELPDSDRFLDGDYMRENPMYSAREVQGFIDQAVSAHSAAIFNAGIEAAAGICKQHRHNLISELQRICKS